MINRQWGGGGHHGKIVKFLCGKFAGTIAILDCLSGDCFYYATDPLSGKEVYGYMSEFEFLADDYFDQFSLQKEKNDKK